MIQAAKDVLIQRVCLLIKSENSKLNNKGLNRSTTFDTMELPDMFYNQAEYIETASGNKVCRKSVLCGSQNIVLHGKVSYQVNAIFFLCQFILDNNPIRLCDSW